MPATRQCKASNKPWITNPIASISGSPEETHFDPGKLFDDEEELHWPPNPYQVQADAQVLAGAWPGTNLLMGLHAPDGNLMQTRYESETIADEHLGGGDEADQWDCEDCNGESWDGGPWRFLFEFRASDRAENEVKTSSSSTKDTESTGCTDEGDVDADLLQTSCGSLTDGDDSGAQFSDSQRQCLPVKKLSHQCVPRNTDLGKKFGEGAEQDIHTLMIRNIPNLYTRSMLMEELDSLGFGGAYDFIYLPIDKSTQWNVGYAFVNFDDPAVSRNCMSTMMNYTFKKFEHGTGKIAQVSIAYIQGLEQNLRYYSKTAVQCSRMQSHRPLVLKGGASELLGKARKHNRRRRRKRVEDTDSQNISSS